MPPFVLIQGALHQQLQHNDGDSAIAFAHIAIFFQFRKLLEHRPCVLVGFAPVLTINAGANFSTIGHLTQGGLQGNA